MFYAKWELHKLISLVWQKKLNFAFLVNPLYSAVSSQICLKPKVTCGWTLGLCTATPKAAVFSFNHLYFYIRLLNMLLHEYKSTWVTKDAEHCLPKAVRKGPALTARARSCCAVSLKLLTSAWKPSFIFILQDPSAMFWNVCSSHPGTRKLLRPQCLHKSEMRGITCQSWKTKTSHQTRAITKRLRQHDILPLSDAKTEHCSFLAWAAPSEVVPTHRRVREETSNKIGGDNQQPFILNLQMEDQKVNFKVPALVVTIGWIMLLFSRASFGKYTHSLLQFDLAVIDHNRDYGAVRRLFCTCFRVICPSQTKCKCWWHLPSPAHCHPCWEIAGKQREGKK